MYTKSTKLLIAIFVFMIFEIMLSPIFAVADGHFVATEAEASKVSGCAKLPSIGDMEKELREIYNYRACQNTKNYVETPIDRSSSTDLFGSSSESREFSFAEYKTETVLESEEGCEKYDTFNLDGFFFRDRSFQEILDLHVLTSDRALYGKSDLKISSKDKTKKEKFRSSNEDNVNHERIFDLSMFQNKSPDCHDILCAVKNIFEPSQGIMILWAYKKYGLNLSRYQFVHGIDFNLEELDSAIRAVSLLPAHLRSQIAPENGLHFFRFKNGTRPIFSNELAIANAFGAVFEIMDEYSASEKVYIFTHEYGHRAARLNVSKERAELVPRSRDYASDWLQITGWKTSDITSEYELTDNQTISKTLSTYARTSPSEDFAETFAAYRFAPFRLKEKSPERYHYMRVHIFKGIEYTSDICKGERYAVPF